MTQNAVRETIKVKDKEMQRNQFASVEDKDLRCRNIATMILNYYEDSGEEAALMYSAMNIQDKDEEHVKAWVLKIADERGYIVGVH